MRVLLVNPVMKRYYKSPTCPLGLLSIATYLHQQGHIIKIIDAAVKNVNYQKEISAFQPDIVGVSVISNKSIADAVRVSKTARSQKIPVVWGGTLAS
ncbi:MAG TPA: cobalamin B12-binding domain-containing protein, partial [Clostridiales bacterium]|nr:cobalamin B12-binding domain-containing protein [Clostridiales bacterium]